MAGLRQRLARLEERMPKPEPPPPGMAAHIASKRAVLKRLGLLLVETDPLVTPEDAHRIIQAFELWRAENSGPYSVRLRGLCEGWSRLPKLRPEVFAKLLVTWLDPQVDNMAHVCEECGLELPRHKPPPYSILDSLRRVREPDLPDPHANPPKFFPECPHCGASDRLRNWPHLVPNHDYAWKKLDGMVIPDPRNWRTLGLK